MHRLTPPDRLYGREREVAALTASFERVSNGSGEILLLPGRPGVGKTALAQEAARPIRDRNGFFAQGKFDQYQQNTPYFAISQALTDLCVQLLAGDSAQLDRWRRDITQAIGPLGRLLVDLAPCFESLLGPQQPLDDISPQEARHRFARMVSDFLKAVCRPEHPLVLFIDDWQWSDPGSLRLLRHLRIGSDLRYLLVIGSYRDNEVDATHPLTSTLEELLLGGVPLTRLPVGELGFDDVHRLVDDAIGAGPGETAELARLLHAKTGGNPFFVRSYLGYLEETGYISFHDALGRWQWRHEELEAAALPDDVVDLFVRRLHRLDEPPRSLLSLAACLGNRFDLDTLGIISARGTDDVAAVMSSPGVAAMLTPVANADADGWRRFLHDRVQQAAYSLIAPEALPEIHLRIGRLLLASLPPGRLEERAFEVAGDFNAAVELIHDPDEALTVVELNAVAGRRAATATAYRAALGFYRAAGRLLMRPGLMQRLWRDRHDLAMRLLLDRAECEFLEGDREMAEHCVHEAAAHAESAVEKAGALSVLIVHQTLLARYPEAIAAGREALGALGISLPEGDFEAARDREIAKVRRQLGDRDVLSLADLPVMTDPQMLMATKILITMGPPCYRWHQRLWAVIVPKVVGLTLGHGNVPQVGYSHTAFGGLLGWVDDDYHTAEQFGELASALMTKTFRAPSDQSVFYLMIGSSIRPWFKHLRYASHDYEDAYETGLQSGNLQYAAYAFGHNMYCRFYQATPLDTLIRETQGSLDFSRSRLNQWAIDLLEGGLIAFSKLTGGPSATHEGASWADEEYLQRVADHGNIQVACIYRTLKEEALLFLGDHDQALRVSDEAEELIFTVGTQGLLPWPEHVFARFLILTALYPGAASAQQAAWRQELDRTLRRLRTWADHSPDNFEHKHLLARAELAVIDEKPLRALRLYDQAIDDALAGDFLQWAGIASERASAFCARSGSERLAQIYLQQAYICYDMWGATAKVRALETALRESLEQRLRADGMGGDGAHATGDLEELLDDQVARMRHQASLARAVRLEAQKATQAEELADATARLRLEVTVRKRAEAEVRSLNERLEERVLARTAQLEAANRELEAFVYSAAHDLRTPLRAIDGFSQLVAEDAVDRLTATEVGHLQRVRAAAQRMGLLIDHLQTLSSFEAKPLHIELVDLSTMARIIGERLADGEPKRSVDFVIEPGLTAYADAALLQQILQHLLENAWKFTSHHARARIVVGAVDCGGERAFFVRDDGAGFDPASSDHLFGAFQRLHPADQYEGDGIGLATVRRLVARHGGRVWAEAEVEKGATFYFTLPAPAGPTTTE